MTTLDLAGTISAQSRNDEGVVTVNPYIGQVNLFPWKWAPVGWAKCDGTLLPINGNEALYSLLGTTYGGDGRQNFGLPDMRGKKTVNGQRVNYFISLQGMYPSRS